jgi:uncharacterized protein YggE
MNHIRLVFALLLGYSLTAHARAQTVEEETEGTVAGNGTGVIERSPEILRVQVDVFAKGKDLKQTLAKLKKQRSAVEKQLDEMGAESKSVRFEPTKFASLETDQQKQMRTMVRQRMKQGQAKRQAKKPEVKPPVVLAIPLTAEWALTGEGDELMLAANELEEKIKAADLAGLKVAQELTPEEQELAEEMESQDEDPMDFYNGGRQEAKPGEPVFLFACRITDDERDKALAEAFAEAKAEAARLAKAAGAELGRLKDLTVNMENGESADEYDAYQSYSYRHMQRMRGRVPESTSTREAVGMRAGPLKYHVAVTARFVLK